MKSSILALFPALIFAAVLAEIPGPARADGLADAIQSLDAAVRDVRIAGTWEKDGQKGVFRIIVARSADPKPTARLFVQWLAIGDDGSQAVQRGVEVKELVDLKLDISDFVTEPDADGLTVFVETLDPTTDADQSYELLIDNDGTYRFGPASN